MTDTSPVVDAPAEGPWPIWPVDDLLERIQNLPGDRRDHLATTWMTEGLPSLVDKPLLTTEQYQSIEELVAGLEEEATDDERGQVRGWMERLGALPEHVHMPAFEQMGFRGGMDSVVNGHRFTKPRIEIMRRIVEDALGIAQEPGPAERQAAEDKAAEPFDGDYPGAKAKIDTVKEWVGDDPNRIARAYAHELDRQTPRKRFIAWLQEALGPERLEVVHESMASAKAPPLSLGNVVSAIDEVEAELAGSQVEEDQQPQAPVDLCAGEAEEDGVGLVTPGAGSSAAPDEGSLDSPLVAPSTTETDELAEAIANAGHYLILAAKLLRQEVAA